MTSLRTLILYVSVHHQNTATVAHVISSILHADLCTPDEVTHEKIDDYDLIGFGSGIYFGRFHPSLRQWINGLPDAPARHHKSFVFSTEGLPSLWRLWHWPLKSKLSQKGFDVVSEFHCSGFDSVGPLQLFGGLNRRHPDGTDLGRAEAFARQLLAQLADTDSSHNVPASQ
jgi:flavodoxin